MTPNDEPHDPAACPLCGHDNHCQLCSLAAYKGQCWCASMKFPEGLLERVPPESRNRACVCRDCVTSFKAEGQARATE